MDTYKLIFEKKYADRCISKNVTKEVIVKTNLEMSSKIELTELGHSKLLVECPDFFQNAESINPAGWTTQIIKEIVQINKHDK